MRPSMREEEPGRLPEGFTSYHDGGDVDKTGPAMLEKGEHVLSKEATEKVKDSMGAGKKKESKKEPEKKDKKAKKKGGKRVKEMHVRRGASGGYIAKHDFERPTDAMAQMPESEEHILPDMNALHDHMDEHMGEEQQEAAGGAEPAAPAAPQGAPAPEPGM